MLKIFGFSPKREEKLWKSVFWVEMLKWECDSPTESTYLGVERLHRNRSLIRLVV